MLGYKDVKAYDGSSQEYAKDPNAPMVKYRGAITSEISGLKENHLCLEKQLVFNVSEVKGKIAHGGAATVRILIDDITCGAKNFSFLVNTMTAGLNCNVTGTGHSHQGEHCMFGLSGTGGISVDGVIFNRI